MNLQEIYDKTVRALHAQGGPSIRMGNHRHPVCAYRGQGGRKCAAGVHIPDEAYVPGMEMLHMADIFRPLGFDHGQLLLLTALRRAHDTSTANQHGTDYATMPFKDTFPKSLRDVANHFHLSSRTVDECWPPVTVPA